MTKKKLGGFLILIGLVFFILFFILKLTCHKNVFLAFALLGVVMLFVGVVLTQLDKLKERGMSRAVFSVVAAIACAVVCTFTYFGSTIEPTGSGSDREDGGTTYTCGVCDNTYRSSTSNSKSIRRTGMCVSCYKVYKAWRELPVK